jgi:hypothetical protein
MMEAAIEGSRMKYLVPAISLALLAFAPARAETTAIESLGRLAGTWESSATATLTPYSAAGSTKATTACSWSASREFLICQQSVSADGKITQDVAVYTYDSATVKYHFFALRTGGVTDVGITVDTTGIMYTNTFTDGSKNVTVRTLNVWDAPDHYRFWTEYTTDGSQWIKMLTGSAHRTQAAQ